MDYDKLYDIELKLKIKLKHLKQLLNSGKMLSSLSLIITFTMIFIILKCLKYTPLRLIPSFELINNIICTIIMVIMLIIIFTIKYTKLFADIVTEDVEELNTNKIILAPNVATEIGAKLAPYLQIYREYGNRCQLKFITKYYDAYHNEYKTNTDDEIIGINTNKQFPTNQTGLILAKIDPKDDVITIGLNGSNYQGIEPALQLKHFSISLSDLMLHDKLTVIQSKSKIKKIEQFLTFTKGNESIQRLHWNETNHEILYFDTSDMQLKTFTFK